MDELLKMLIEAAEKEGKVHVIKKTVNKDNSIEKEALALVVATLN